MQRTGRLFVDASVHQFQLETEMAPNISFAAILFCIINLNAQCQTQIDALSYRYCNGIARQHQTIYRNNEISGFWEIVGLLGNIRRFTARRECLPTASSRDC